MHQKGDVYNNHIMLTLKTDNRKDESYFHSSVAQFMSAKPNFHSRSTDPLKTLNVTNMRHLSGRQTTM